MDPPSSYYQDFPTNPKLDYFRFDLVDGWLANHMTLPSTYLEMKTYINDATTTLMGGDNVKYIWTLTPSPSKPSTHYAKIDRTDLRHGRILRTGTTWAY